MAFNYFGNTRTDMLGFIPAKRDRVLEIGCGEGGFSGTLPGVAESWGVDPSPSAKIAGERLTRVFNTTFEGAEPDLPIGYFDVIVCNDVIEHMYDYEIFLQRIGKHLAPGGMLIGSIPNVRYYKNMLEYLIEKDWQYTDHGILDRTHVAFFTQKSLRKTLEKSGFKIVRMEGINRMKEYLGSPRPMLYAMFAYGLVALSLGYFSDIRYLQFAFQAVPAKA